MHEGGRADHARLVEGTLADTKWQGHTDAPRRRISKRGEARTRSLSPRGELRRADPLERDVVILGRDSTRPRKRGHDARARPERADYDRARPAHRRDALPQPGPARRTAPSSTASYHEAYLRTAQVRIGEHLRRSTSGRHRPRVQRHIFPVCSRTTRLTGLLTSKSFSELGRGGRPKTGGLQFCV